MARTYASVVATTGRIPYLTKSQPLSHTIRPSERHVKPVQGYTTGAKLAVLRHFNRQPVPKRWPSFSPARGLKHIPSYHD